MESLGIFARFKEQTNLIESWIGMTMLQPRVGRCGRQLKEWRRMGGFSSHTTFLVKGFSLHSVVRGSAIRTASSTDIPRSDEEACPHELVGLEDWVEAARCPQAKLVASFKHAGVSRDSLDSRLGRTFS